MNPGGSSGLHHPTPELSQSIDGRVRAYYVARMNGTVLGTIRGVSYADLMKKASALWPDAKWPNFYPKRAIDKEKQRFQQLLECFVEKHLRRLSFHEAGHVVVGTLVGRMIKEAHLQPIAMELDGELNLFQSIYGNVSFDGPSVLTAIERSDTEWLSNQVRMDIAGTIAESLALKRPGDSNLANGDLHRAWMLVNNHLTNWNEDAEARMFGLTQRTENDLIAHWDAVSQFAKVLRKQRRMSSGEISTIWKSLVPAKSKPSALGVRFLQPFTPSFEPGALPKDEGKTLNTSSELIYFGR